MKITYLKHSGFLVETEEIYLLFDYYKGDFPEWNTEKKMVVFVSHGHYDHFSKDIFGLADKFPQIIYIFSSDIDSGEIPPLNHVVSVGPGQKTQIEGIEIQTLRSNDLGLAFLVHCGGKRIYHAGDLNWWHWEGEPDRFNKVMRRSYQAEINKLGEMVIDIAFVPVDPRLGEQFCWGLDCFMRRTRTGIVFPMHFWENYDVYDRLMMETCTEGYRERIIKITHENQIFEV